MYRMKISNRKSKKVFSSSEHCMPYFKYGECPAYGKTKEMMEKSIIDYPKFIILYNNNTTLHLFLIKDAAQGTFNV